MKVRRALVSVHDKTGVVELARALRELGVELLSTGGTARLLRDSGVPVREVADVTGFPEMLDGRVKTLHPKIHGGILARRDSPEHAAALEQHGIPPIDLVVVALYPFEATVARPGVTRAEAMEQIDVGGPAMIRAAAKNHASGAGEAGARKSDFPERLRLEAERTQVLRYGENPHQSAAFYRLLGGTPFGLGAMEQLHGPELGYNNLLDLSAALGLLLEFAEPAAVVVKHTNPCGAAIGLTVGAAMAKAKASDPVSIYGGVVGVNRALDLAVVRELAGIFVEILFAPPLVPQAPEGIPRTKKKSRVLP